MHKVLVLLLLATLVLSDHTKAPNPGRPVDPIPIPDTPVDPVPPPSTDLPPSGSTMTGYSGDGQATAETLDSPPSQIRSTANLQRSSQQAQTPDPDLAMDMGMEMSSRQSARWIIPAGTNDLSISPRWRWARYTFDVYTECPLSGFWIWVNAPGAVWVYNNNNYVQGPIWPYPWGRWVYVPRAICGCNKVTIYVWGYWPWLSYGTWLPPQNCAEKCESNPDAFYNRRDCRCECLRKCCKDGYVREDRLPCRCVKKIWGPPVYSDNTIGN